MGHDKWQGIGEGLYPYGSTVSVEAFSMSDSMDFNLWSHHVLKKDTVGFESKMNIRVEGNEFLLAFFKKANKNLQVEIVGKGRVQGAGKYVYGDMADLVAEAAPGYHFTAWKERGMEIAHEAEISLAMRQNRDIVAVFEPDTFHVRLASRIEDVAVFGTGGYANGSQVNIWTGGTPAGYRFAAWKNEEGETVSQESGFVLSLTKDTTLYAEWQAALYKIDLQAEGEGEVSGSGEYGFDTTVLLVATPAEGYRLRAWYYGGNLFSERDTLIWASVSDLALTAVFEKALIPAEPILNRAEGGEILVVEESETSATVNLQATPKENYHFAYWSVEDSVIGTQAQMEVPRETASSTVAHFLPDVYYVTLRSSTPEGLSGLSGSGSFHKGESAKLKATVRKSYEFIGWFEEGSDTPVSVQTEDTITVSRPMKLDARTRKTANQ